MSSADHNIVPFPSPGQPSTGEERLVGEIHAAVRCITAALNRSQRQLHEITRLLLEVEMQGRSTGGGGLQSESRSDAAHPRATGLIGTPEPRHEGQACLRLLVFDRERGTS